MIQKLNTMKTFSKLKIGDSFFVIDKKARLLDYKDNYGNMNESKFVIERKVKSIELIDDDICFNRRTYSYSKDTFDLVLNQHEYNEMSSVNNDDYIYYSDPLDFNNQLRDFALYLLQQQDEIVKEGIEQAEKNKQQIRLKYFDFLNKN